MRRGRFEHGRKGRGVFEEVDGSLGGKGSGGGCVGVNGQREWNEIKLLRRERLYVSIAKRVMS